MTWSDAKMNREIYINYGIETKTETHARFRDE